MKKILAIMLCAVLLLNLCACAGVSALGISSRATSLPEIRVIPYLPAPKKIVCETAEEFSQNMTFGWNLGLALSYYVNKPKADTDGWSSLVYFTGSDGSYSRSNTFAFDSTTKTAEVVWNVGVDGVNNIASNASINNIGIELWNSSLYHEENSVMFKLEELYYVTQNGTEVSCDTSKLTQYTKDMHPVNKTCGVANLMTFENGAVTASNVKEIRAKIKFVSCESSDEFMDVTKAELAFGNPVTTQAMINEVRNKGFNLVRVQVCYITHMDEEGNIDPLWLERVAEVVDYCMNAGVYCLLNVAGGGWLEAERETFDEQSAIYRRLWEQVAERFTGYGELLLFESFNEIRTAEGHWTNAPAEAYGVVSDLHQIFVDTVRASGGYNATRNLVLNTYAAAVDTLTLESFELPEDTVAGHLIGQVHCYTPTEFCFNATNLGHAPTKNEWGSAADKAELDAKLEGIKERFIDELGIPVIIGEFGTVARTGVAEADRAEYVGYYSKKASELGIDIAIFDDGYDFTVFDRETLTWPYESIIQAMLTKGESVESLG